MNTTQFVTWMMNKAGNVVSRSEMLQYIDYAQIQIFGLNTDMNKTKPDPFLDTTAGTKTYTLGDSIRTAIKVYKKTGTLDYTTPIGYNSGVQTNGKILYDIYVTPAKSIASGVNNCVILFDQDPGTTDDVYQIEQYEWPDELTTESIPLSLDEVTARTYLKYLVLKELEEDGYSVSIYNEKSAEEMKEDFLGRVGKPPESFPSNRRKKVRGGGC